ncbi:MAG: hypothetical protein IMW86_02545 [Hydrogenibacillus sp.]|nr:hypothetical protein [Hydrogenibacillus sp.]
MKRASLAIVVLACVCLGPMIRSASAASELDRLYLRLKAVESQLRQTEAQLKDVEAAIARTDAAVRAAEADLAEHKAKVRPIVRALYTDGAVWWLAVLLRESEWGRLIERLTLLESVFAYEQSIVDDFRRTLAELGALKNAAAEKRRELERLTRSLASERQKLAALIAAWEEATSAAVDRNAAEASAKAVHADWQTNGRPLFERYLARLNDAYKAMADAFGNRVKLSLRGAVLTLSDQEITDFLRAYDPLFAGTTVALDDDAVNVSASAEGHAVAVTGQYALEDGMLVFHIRRMTYDSLELPEEAIHELSSHYRLGLNPRELHPLLVIRGFEQKRGILTIWLSLKS